MMLSSFHYCILLVIYLCYCPVHGGDDKPVKNLSKLTDFKAKLAKTQSSYLPPVSADLLSTEENLDNKSISILGITVPAEYANDTIQFDHHIYYNSTFYGDPENGKKWWIDIDSFPQTTIHPMLSTSHRQATTVPLTFDFPFYGSILKNVTIATGGFLYTGDYLHNWIAATQYIAPLMANFDSSQSNDSFIKYADNGTAFTVEWSKIYIKNKMSEGAFTFQVTLFKSGDILFAYKEVPYPVANISDASHPVKIGISDAYVLERSLFFVRRKTIYEYHRIDMLKKSIGSNTALYFTALPTCNGFKECEGCVSADPKMECVWCRAVKRCSSGVDRMRQSWLTNGCSIHVDATCPAASTTTDSSKDIKVFHSTIETSTNQLDKSPMYHHHTDDLSSKGDLVQGASHYVQAETVESSGVSVGAIVTIVLFVVALLGASGWVFYAYRFPQTRSGQFLIKYRPTQWTIRKEESASNSSSRHI